MSVSSACYLAGRLLVAMPGIEDPRFRRAVVFMCVHDADHAMGLAVNRPAPGLTIHDLLEKLGVDPGDAPTRSVVMGGPVEPERGFVLHSDEHGAAVSSVTIPGGLALTASREILEGLAGRQPRPRQAIMAIGYAGWGGGQLEREIRDNLWLTCEPDETLVFGEAHEDKWAAALAKIGVSADRLSAQTGRA